MAESKLMAIGKITWDVISRLSLALMSGDESQKEYKDAVAEIEKLKPQIDDLQKQANDNDNILSSIEEIKNLKQQADILSTLIAANTGLVSGIKASVNNSGKKVIESVEGGVWGIITESTLKEVLTQQMQESVSKNGPYYVVEECVSAVNDNVRYTNILIQGVLKLLLITMVRMLDMTKVDTEKSVRIHEIASNLEHTNTNLSQLLDYSLEASEIVTQCSLKSEEYAKEISKLGAKSAESEASIEELRAKLSQYNSGREKNWYKWLGIGLSAAALIISLIAIL